MAMVYALNDILRVRAAREEKSELCLGQAKECLRSAEIKVEREDARFFSYRQTAKIRRKELFDGVIGKVVSIRDLNLLNAGLANIVREGAEIKNLRDAAVSNLAVKRTEVESARIRYFGARRECEKIREHKADWFLEQREQEDRQCDAEMDEFKTFLGKGK